jgi:signal transduction histidine kinase
MPGFVIPALFGLLAAVALAGLVLALWAHHRLHRAEANRAAAQRAAEARSRRLGLLAQELQGSGLALLGQAGRLSPAQAAAITAKARQLLRLSDDITEFMAAEAGPRSLRPAAVPLAPLLEESVASVNAQLGPAVRQWRIAADFAGLTLQADRRALRGALQQVLARAARMTRDGDWIELRPVLTPESLAIVVEDEGAGLPAEDLASQVPLEIEAEHTRGLGFGLATARSLLEAHGGGLRLEALPNVGARAWLNLPRSRVLAV